MFCPQCCPPLLSKRTLILRSFDTIHTLKPSNRNHKGPAILPQHQGPIESLLINAETGTFLLKLDKRLNLIEECVLILTGCFFSHSSGPANKYTVEADPGVFRYERGGEEQLLVP